MSSQPTLFEDVATLEHEVARAQERLDAISRSIRAASVEAVAAKDPDQFDREAFRPWWRRRSPPPPDDPSALSGFMCGVTAGTMTLMLVKVVLLWLAK